MARLSRILQRPLSTLTAAIAAGLILVPLYARVFAGAVYLERLDNVDGTTLIMVGALLLRGIYTLLDDSDLQAASLALVGALSFLLAFEALFKLSFYTFPWRMPPNELRAFILQAAAGLTVLVGFAFGRYRITGRPLFFLGVFAALWFAWLVIGFPQLSTGEPFYRPRIDGNLSWDAIYMLNRAAKGALFLAYFFFYPSQGDG